MYAAASCCASTFDAGDYTEKLKNRINNYNQFAAKMYSDVASHLELASFFYRPQLGQTHRTLSIIARGFGAQKQRAHDFVELFVLLEAMQYVVGSKFAKGLETGV